MTSEFLVHMLLVVVLLGQLSTCLGNQFFSILIHMAGESGTHALPLTSGMILTQNWTIRVLIRVLSYLPGLVDYGVELGAWSQLSQSEHCLRQLLEL